MQLKQHRMKTIFENENPSEHDYVNVKSLNRTYKKKIFQNTIM